MYDDDYCKKVKKIAKIEIRVGLLILIIHNKAQLSRFRWMQKNNIAFLAEDLFA